MKKQTIFLVLDNLRSAFNIGSIFRTADAAGVAKIFVCGHSPKPSDAKVIKTALGAEKSVLWEYYPQTWRLLKKLKKDGIIIVALEQTPKAINYRKFKPKFPLALILGNEVKGLSKKILDSADKIIAIPMYGQKESLNVSVAIGIALYGILEKATLR